ncbi:MAG: transposase, partial [Thermogemmata sp.]
MDLTDEQWAVLEPLLPQEERLPTGRRGRTGRNPREVLNGIL